MFTDNAPQKCAWGDTVVSTQLCLSPMHCCLKSSFITAVQQCFCLFSLLPEISRNCPLFSMALCNVNNISWSSLQPYGEHYYSELFSQAVFVSGETYLLLKHSRSSKWFAPSPNTFTMLWRKTGVMQDRVKVFWNPFLTSKFQWAYIYPESNTVFLYVLALNYFQTNLGFHWIANDSILHLCFSLLHGVAKMVWKMSN